MIRVTAILLAASLVTAVAGCSIAQSRTTERVDLGTGVYAMSKRAGFLSGRTSELKVQVEQEALADCSARGLALAVLDSSTAEPDPPGYPSATVQYRCVPR